MKLQSYYKCIFNLFDKLNLNGIELYDYRIKSHHPHGVCKIDRGKLVTHSKSTVTITSFDRKNDLILIMTLEKQDTTSELSKHWYPDSTLASRLNTGIQTQHWQKMK